MRGEPAGTSDRHLLRMSADDVSRFLDKVERRAGCWMWRGTLFTTGYSQFRLRYGIDAVVSAHRAAYWIAYDVLPGRMSVCHHCDNRQCVRPDHLFLGTTLDNMRDMWTKGRRVPRRGSEVAHLAKVTERDVAEIRRQQAAGVSQSRLAKVYGVSQAAISSMILRKTWAHVS